MTRTQTLIVVGSTLSLAVAIVAFATGNETGGAVIALFVAAWLTWAFSGDRG